VELFSTAEVEGDITTVKMVMESGCIVNGLCTMRADGNVSRREVAGE